MKLPDQKFRAAKTSARRLERSLIRANSASVSLWDKVVHVVAGICSLRRSACIQGGRDLHEVNGATRALHEAHLGSLGSEPYPVKMKLLGVSLGSLKESSVAGMGVEL